MARSISAKHCLYCREDIEPGAEGFAVNPAKFIQYSETENEKRSWRNQVSLDKTYYTLKGSNKFGFHHNCFIKMMWYKDHPDVKMEEIYFDYITIGVCVDEVVWKFGGLPLSGSPTEEELKDRMSALAKSLLRKNSG